MGFKNFIAKGTHLDFVLEIKIYFRNTQKKFPDLIQPKSSIEVLVVKNAES